MLSLCVNFLKELCLFVNLEYWKYTVFHTFLLHALTYSADILHMTLFWCTTEQVRVSSLNVNFWTSYASFGTKIIGNTQFSAFFSCMLWHIELKFCTWLCFNVIQSKLVCCHFASIFEGVMPLCELRIYRKCAVFRTFLLHALRCWAEILQMTLFIYITDQVQVLSLCIRLDICPSIIFLELASYMHWQLSWKFKKIDFGSFNAFLLEKRYIKKRTFKNVHDGRIMHRLRCLGIFFNVKTKLIL